MTLACGAAAGAPSSKPWKDCPTCPSMVRIPPGAFRMGGEGGEAGRPEGPLRTITFAHAFALGRTEVTNAQYAQFVKAAGYAVPGACRTLIDGAFKPSPEADWRRPGVGMTAAPDLPVVCVSWADATAYAAWLSKRTGHAYRLPTEAEWEYGARAGGEGTFFWGEDESAACTYGDVYDASAAELKLGWTAAACDDHARYLAPVASYRPNAFGLYDTVGNAWEWTQDCYVAPYPAAPADGSAVPAPPEGCERRTVRGGGWMTRVDRARSSFRGRDPEAARYSYFGFRIARDMDGRP